MKKPKVFVSRLLPDEALEHLRASCEVEVNGADRTLTPVELKKRLDGSAGLVSLLTDAVGDDVLATPGLKCVSNVAVGHNNVDVAAATRRKVLVTNTPGVLTETTADFAWALMMAAARRIPEADRYTRRGLYQGWDIMSMLGVDVHNKTLGLVGFGRIGVAMAQRAKGFGMRVLYSDVKRAPEDLESAVSARHATLSSLLSQSDFVSVHVPLSPETRHLIGAKELGEMKRTAVLINTARGAVIDEAALVAALRKGTIFAAGLDVYENEPDMAPGLAELDNVVLAPHIASASSATRTRMAMIAASDMVAALEGRRPSHLVNPEALG
ncbi:MAG: D-glycerate dehydrogenase [Elusimicrobia bacterium]|nr:D-glycerate dehydrogenase [Elusimicrobiota bacterium]